MKEEWNWFFEVKYFLNEEELDNILDDPKMILNCDEMAFFFSPKIYNLLILIVND